MALKNSKSELAFIDKYRILTEDFIDLNNKTIFIYGELPEDLGTDLKVKCNAIRQYWEEIKRQAIKEIKLDIASCGGSIYSVNGTLDFYDELKSEGILINTHAQGICMSAATVILAGGTGIRSASKRCKFMLHDIQVENIGAGTASQIIQMGKDLEQEQDDFFRFYIESVEKKTNLRPDQLKNEIKKWKKKFAGDSIDKYISADEALKLKLIDKII